MMRTAIVSMVASFVLVSAWTVNLVTYHPATDLNPLAPLSTNVDGPPYDTGREMMFAAAAMVTGTLVIALIGNWLI